MHVANIMLLLNLLILEIRDAKDRSKNRLCAAANSTCNFPGTESTKYRMC